MEDPVVYAIKDPFPYVALAISIALGVASWAVSSWRSRVGELVKAWASWMASASDAAQRRREVLELEDRINAELAAKEAVSRAGFAERFGDRVGEVLAPHERSAADAIRKLREDYYRLQLLDRDTKALEPAASIVNLLSDRSHFVRRLPLIL
jgi:xanthine/CO dehydrogenase XdhC/CoxF family maturation factor